MAREWYVYLNNEEQKVEKAKRNNHKWTTLEKAVVYFVFATKANEVGVDNIRSIIGGTLKYREQVQEMVEQIRRMAKGCLDQISDDAIHSQLTQCGYSLIEAHNGYTHKGQEDLYLELHKEMRVWNGLQ